MTRFISLLLAPLLALVAPPPAPVPPPAPAFHCQVPCGIFDDAARLDAMRQDVTTIAKAIDQLSKDELSMNQAVRWILTKEQHAQAIQEQVSDYWLAQRIKIPAAGADQAVVDTYLARLAALHRLTVSAMRCKQAADPARVDTLSDAVDAFGEAYFSEEDLLHLREHR